MAIQKDDLISASDVNTYLASKSANKHLNLNKFGSVGRGDTTSAYNLWIRDRDLGYPHAAIETDHGLWSSGVGILKGETVLGLSRRTGLSDGIIWVAQVDTPTQRPGELYWTTSVISENMEWLPQQGWNFSWNFDMGGRYLTRIDIVKQIWNGSDWVDDYFIVSQNLGNSPDYQAPVSIAWPGSSGKMYYWLAPGYYKTSVKDEFSGFGRSSMFGYNKPWQKDMVEDEYIRTYTSDLSDFTPALVTISDGIGGRLGSTTGIVDDPPGGKSG